MIRGSASLEALIASVLLAAGSVPLAQAAASCERHGFVAAQRETASALANEAAEQVGLAEGFDSAAWSSRVAARLPGGSGTLVASAPLTVRIEVRWQVADAPGQCPGVACVVRTALR